MPPSPLPPPRDLAPADDESALLPASDLDALRAALAGRYAIERPLGAGGMGSVWLGRDEALDRPVAIKVIAPELTASPVLRGRFLQEARTVARLRHRHIVQVYAAGEAAGLLWFAMEYVAGGSLRDRLAEGGALPPGEAAPCCATWPTRSPRRTAPGWCTAT
jgi:serine/threonine-protein kinase